MTARIIQIRRGASTRFPGSSRTEASLMFEPLPFMSECPRCKDVRAQQGYCNRTLLKLLSRNLPVEAYCIVCDEFWPISANERNELAKRLTD